MRRFRYSDSAAGAAEVNHHCDDYRKPLGRQNPPIPGYPNLAGNHPTSLPLLAKNAVPVVHRRMRKPENPAEPVRVSA